MSCEQWREKLSAYADGAVDASEAKEIEGHLSGCSLCRRELGFMRSMKSAIAGLPSPKFPQDAKEALLTEARRRGQRQAEFSKPSFWVLPIFRYGASAALAAGLATFALILSRGKKKPAASISINSLLAAHEEYVLGRPLAPTEILYSQLPQQVETGETDDRAL